MDTNNYNYYEEDDEISLLNLIGYVFRHLKKILIVSIVVALVLGGLLGYKKSRVNKEERSANMEAYLEDKESLEKQIDLATKNLNNYIEYSSFFDLNTENSYQARALYYVDTGYQVIPDSTYQNPDFTWAVINTYIGILTSNDVLDNVSKKYNINENSINDYISISNHDYMIDISVYHSNEDTALAILHYLEDALMMYRDEVSSKITDNTLSKVTENIYKGLNNNIITIQQNKMAIINGQIDSLMYLKNQLDSLSKPEIENVSFIKQFIKFGIVAFAGLFVIMCAYYSFVFIFGDKVYSTNEFKDKIKIKVLGNLTYEKNVSKYINWINKLENRPTVNDYELIASNINAYGNAKKILLSSDLENSIKEDIVFNLKKLLKDVEIVSCGSLLTDSSAINELDNVDSVILLAKCNKSSYKTIEEEKNKLDDLKVTQIYAIVVE